MLEISGGRSADGYVGILRQRILEKQRELEKIHGEGNFIPKRGSGSKNGNTLKTVEFSAENALKLRQIVPNGKNYPMKELPEIKNVQIMFFGNAMTVPIIGINIANNKAFVQTHEFDGNTPLCIPKSLLRQPSQWAKLKSLINR